MGVNKNYLFLFAFAAFSLFFHVTQSVEVINVNWAYALGSGKEVQNCTENCDSICGNNRCEANESPCNCPCDCGFCCTDGLCRVDQGETVENCPSDCLVTLRGRVTDPTGAAISGAQVHCLARGGFSDSISSDANGEFSFSGVAPDYYTCTASMAGYQKNSQQVLVQNVDVHRNIPAVIPLQVLFGSITGEVNFLVADGASVSPLESATVTCSNGPLQFTRQTDSLGAFFLPNLPLGNYVCTARKASFSSVDAEVTVTQGENLAVGFALEPLPGTLIGRVIDTISGNGVDRMRVDCNSVQGSTQTNEDGFFSLTDVPAGSITCTAQNKGYISGTTTTLVPQGASVTMTIYVSIITSSLTGRIVNSKDFSEALWDAQISCARLFDSSHTQQVVADRYGAFRFGNILPGNYSCQVSRIGFNTTKVDVYLPVGSSVTIQIQVPPLISYITGYVFDAWTGASINEGTVVCVDTDRGGVETARIASQLDGSYALPGIDVGRVNTCTFTKTDFAPQTICQRIIRGVNYNWVVRLTPLTGNLTGTIRDVISGQPLFNVTVTCSSGGNTNTTYTSEFGEFILVGVRSGFHYCTFNAPRFVGNDTVVHVLPGQSSYNDVALYRLKSTIRGEVYDGTLGLLIPANVTCFDPNGVQTNNPTDFLGLFTIADTESYGTWTCVASRTGFADGTNSTFVDFGLVLSLRIYILPQVGIIAGKVTDALSGNPIVGALVDCRQVVDIKYAVFSDPLGTYRIIQLTRGVYGCVATAKGYSSSTARVVLVEGGSARQDYQLFPSPSALLVTVLDSSTIKQAPLANASVICSNGTKLFAGLSAADGTVAFNNLLSGNYSCTFSYPNYISQSLTTFLATGETQKITALIAPTMSTVSGTIYSIDSKANSPIIVPGAQIDVYEIKSGRLITQAFSNLLTGTYSFNVRVPEAYRLNISAPLYLSSSATIGIIITNSTFNFNLIPSALLVTATVTEAGSGKPIANAGVGVRRVVAGQADQPVSYQATDVAGKVTFTGLPASSYRLTVSATGYNDPDPALVDASLMGRIYAVSFSLTLKVGEVRGSIGQTGSASQSLGGFLVTLLGTSFSTLTDDSGAFAFGNVPSGTYTIVISGAGFNNFTSTFTLGQGTSVRLDPITVSKVAGGIDGNVFKAGTVNDPTGVLLQIKVRLSGSENNQYMGAFTIPSGKTAFYIPGLAPGYLYDVLTFTPPNSGFKDAPPVTVQVFSGTNTTVTIYLGNN